MNTQDTSPNMYARDIQNILIGYVLEHQKLYRTMD